jgi:predicted Fe-S protein YdhL (DUF1289 family)
MPSIHITDIESAINFWRDKSPSLDGVTLSKEIHDLAEIYALMVYHHSQEVDTRLLSASAMQAWMTWYDSTPDTPCIAICSTSQGDELCKGCGRTFDEVQLWTEMDAVAKRQTWRRITLEAQAWRFNRYAERAIEDQVTASPV